MHTTFPWYKYDNLNRTEKKSILIISDIQGKYSMKNSNATTAAEHLGDSQIAYERTKQI